MGWEGKLTDIQLRLHGVKFDHSSITSSNLHSFCISGVKITSSMNVRWIMVDVGKPPLMENPTLHV